ncbi:hypothetical protein [Kineosporia babensis]|uniref:Uncharacterized protein n=1 Tax=Kineosporia babensis TaxID=499548 RepID=A0A9X1NPU7_9ACTN|nr:hypothetical protein [Kineosporia babensis]MCD5317076.1 hypothetical protein [Kineosporia babensis]
MPKRERSQTPQQKKALSLARDGRNVYGESNRSRRAVRLRKRLVNRANRRAGAVLLAPARDPEQAEVVEIRLVTRRSKTWRKVPDVSLAEFLARRKTGTRWDLRQR